ncbi:MAG: dienelactone hydrolase family protein [Dehalococcoidales bacterium]|nr:MAG: dienelactone hydrolase family protein [Dehalococcoidales bacterium]
MTNEASLRLIGVKTKPLDTTQTDVVLSTSHGDIRGILHHARGSAGIIWVCGALGGLDGPSFGIFKDLSQELTAEGITSLRLDYRVPGDVPQCVLDVLVGIHFLGQEGVEDIGLVGHSFGGAVVIQAGVMSPQVKTVVGLSSQTYGAHPVDKLSPKPLLLIHGERDQNLPADCSRQIYQWAREPKELVIYQNNGHFLRECHYELHDLIKDWLVNKLKQEAPQT